MKKLIGLILLAMLMAGCKASYTEAQKDAAVKLVQQATVPVGDANIPIINIAFAYVQLNDWKWIGWDCAPRGHVTYGFGISVAALWKDHNGEEKWAEWLVTKEGELHAINDKARAFGTMISFNRQAAKAIFQ